MYAPASDVHNHHHFATLHCIHVDSMESTWLHIWKQTTQRPAQRGQGKWKIKAIMEINKCKMEHFKDGVGCNFQRFLLFAKEWVAFHNGRWVIKTTSLLCRMEDGLHSTRSSLYVHTHKLSTCAHSCASTDIAKEIRNKMGTKNANLLSLVITLKVLWSLGSPPRFPRLLFNISVQLEHFSRLSYLLCLLMHRCFCCWHTMGLFDVIYSVLPEYIYIGRTYTHTHIHKMPINLSN